MKDAPEPSPEKKGRTEYCRGQRAMQRRAAAVPMAMAAELFGRAMLLARVAKAVFRLEA